MYILCETDKLHEIEVFVIQLFDEMAKLSFKILNQCTFIIKIEEQEITVVVAFELLEAAMPFTLSKEITVLLLIESLFEFFIAVKGVYVV